MSVAVGGGSVGIAVGLAGTLVAVGAGVDDGGGAWVGITTGPTVGRGAVGSGVGVGVGCAGIHPASQIVTQNKRSERSTFALVTILRFMPRL